MKRRVIGETFRDDFRRQAKQWIDKHLGEHFDEGASKEEIESLAEMLVKAFDEGSHLASDDWNVLLNEDGEPYAVDNGEVRRAVNTALQVEPVRVRTEAANPNQQESPDK